MGSAAIGFIRFDQGAAGFSASEVVGKSVVPGIRQGVLGAAFRDP